LLSNRRRPLVFSLLSLAAAACSRPPERPPVVLVTFDTTRVDHLSAYGYRRETTPHLEALLSRGAVRFDRMIAASNNTSCSFASVHAGVHVKTHGVIKLAPFGYPLDPSFRTLGEVLGGEGYFRVAAVGAAHLNGVVSGIGRGFDRFFEHPPDPAEIEKPCERTNAELLPFLEETFGRGGERRPLFLWLHYFDPHWPYEPPPPFDTAFAPDGPSAPKMAAPPEGFSADASDRDLRENRAKYEALYDGEIRRTDAAMGEVFSLLDRLGLLGKAIVVFTADHGENLGEHDLFFNHLGIYDPVVRIPLVVRLPGMTAARTSDALVHHVDLLPTILDSAGIPPALWPPNEGVTLKPILLDRLNEAHSVAFSEAAHFREKSVRDDRYKLIVDGSLQKLSLFDIVNDPGETRNLAAEKAAEAERLLAALERFVGDIRFRFHAVPDPGAAAPRALSLRVRARNEIATFECVGFAAGDAAPDGAGKDRVARLKVGPADAAGKGIRAVVPHGALFLDAVGATEPVDSNEIWLSGRKPSKDSSTPLVFFPGEEATFPGRAPSTRPALVRVEEISRDEDAARYRFTLGPVPAGIEGKTMMIRAGTDGVLSDARRIAGTLHYAGFDVPDRFRISSLDARQAAAFEITVRPGSAAFFMEAKVDDRRVSNLEIRRGPGGDGDDRRYPATFFVSPNGLGFETDPAAVASDYMKKPGLHVWIDADPEGRRRSARDVELDPAMRELLDKLGYVGAGGGGGAQKKKPAAGDTKPAPDEGAGATPSGSPSDAPRR